MSQQPRRQQPQQYQQQPYQQQPYPQQAPPPAPSGSGAGKAIGAIIIVIVVVVALIAVVYFISGQSTLKVRINSEHWISTVNFELYLDGDRKKTGSISPGSYYEYTFTLYPGPSCTTYNVFASSVGGTFGGESDSENVYLCAGETKSVDLYI
ncbi:MAG: hypothetical protein ACW992_12115 [Candidatus Thorarchaeota archaeon]|jgi:hypothetical protein